MKNGFIPLSLPEIGEEDTAQVMAALPAGGLNTGSRAELFADGVRRFAARKTAGARVSR